jgi:dynein intermediate chain
MDFHPARGAVDLGDLVLTTSLDWTVKLWRVRAPAATSTTGSLSTESASFFPVLDFTREDVVYNAAWSPVKPGVFSVVDGAGTVEVWDLTVDTEVPISKAQPSSRKDGRSMMSKSLNRIAWEQTEGKRLAVGGLDGAITVFEVGPDLGGKDSAKNEEWTSVKKLVAKMESAAIGSVNGVNGV